MSNKANIWVTLVGILIGAIAYWFQPYNQMTVLGIHIWLLMSSGALLGSLLLTVYLHEMPSKIGFLCSFCRLVSIKIR